MPLQATSGAASYDAFGGGVAAVPNYIEECFSTTLYTGNGSTQTITNGIDLSTKGGLVWWKNRTNATGHGLIDTTRGIDYYLSSNTTDAQDGPASYISSVSSTGYSIGVGTQFVNQSANNYASWTFRKQPKFFDVVTYTGNGTNGRTVAHSLGSTPGCIIVKRTDASNGWAVYHRAMNASPQDYMMRLNATDAAFTTSPSRWNNTLPTSTEFTLSGNDEVNGSGATYVAYLFAHDAGGFGLTGTDNVISCGSYTGNALSDGPTITLGFEPQWILVKDSSFAANWQIVDTMRGLTVESDNVLRPNTTAAEYAQNLFSPTATGFKVTTTSSDVNREFSTYIYIAIRRGPMKVPTSGTSVFSAQTGTYSAGDSLSVDFPADMYIDAWRTGTLYKANYSRLVNFANSNSSASQNYLKTNTTDAEVTTSQAPSLYDLWNTTAKVGSWNAGVSEVWWMFRRAPSFFDVVCYTGTGSATTFSHNLGVVPELMIVKRRNASSIWAVYAAPLANASTSYLELSEINAVATGNTVLWNSTSPTSTVFTIGSSSNINTNGSTNVAYLFATCAGVSKVGSYTGTATTLQVDCGFTGGARFVLIKRTDSTGDWYVWDSARGIVSGNDPYLLLNSTAAEVTSTDYIDTYSAGFEISSTAPAAINASGGTFIFLAIA